MVLVKSLKFWALVVSLILFILQAYVPGFPFGEDVVLKFVLFILGLLHIEPEIRTTFGGASR